MAHIAIYKERFVETKKWLKEDEFVELFGIC
jgi:chromate transport protein ChrA